MFTTQKVIAASFFFLLFAVAVAAQDDPCLRRTVAINVFDLDGKLVTGLTPKDFRAELKGKPVSILSVDLDQRPHRLVVVLDASASMFDGEKQWDLARSLAEAAVAASPARFQAGLIVFNDAVRIRIPIQSDPGPALQALVDLPQRPLGHDARVGRHTSLWDALLAATEMLAPPRFGDAIYVVTDGADNQSKASIKSLRRTLHAQGIRVFSAWFGYDVIVEPMLADVLGVNDFINLVAESGGLLARIPPRLRLGLAVPKYSQLGPELQAEIRVQTQEILDAVQFPYRLAAALPAPLAHLEKWKLYLPRPQRGQPGWLLSYPAQMESCSATVVLAN